VKLSRKLAVLLLILPLVLALGSLVSRAADHKDSPTADGAPEGDITDFFAFLDPNDATQLVLIMDVNPFSVPAETSSYRFSTNFLYQFKIANDGVAREDFVIQAIFKNDTTCASGQSVSLFGPTRPRIKGATNVVVQERAALSGCTSSTLTSSSGLKVFTGLRDDPFVFDIGQFFRITSGKQDVFRDLPNTPLGHLRGRSLHSDGTSGVDGFGGFNISAIAVEFPKSWVEGKTSKLDVWATVSMNVDHRGDSDGDHHEDHDGVFMQFQRMGQQVFKTVFVPAAQREAFNASVPENDVKNWSSLVPNALTSNDTTGNTIAARFDLLNSLGLFALPAGAPALLPRNFVNTDKNFVREATLPDVLRLDLSLAPTDQAIGQFGYQNGRRPADAVLDITMRIARQLLDVDFAGSGRAGALQFPLSNLAAADRRVFVVLQGTDFIKPDASVPDVTFSGNDRPLLAGFPFLANPHPLPGETTPAPGTVGFPAQQ
jgi:hypothetical protein